jgi:hypothetical protein
VKKVEPDNSNGSCEAAFKNAQEDPNRRLHETLPAMYAQWWANNQQAELENHLAEQDEFEIVATSINRKRNSSHLSEDMEQAVADDKATSIWKKNSRDQQKQDFLSEFRSLLSNNFKTKKDALNHVNSALKTKELKTRVGYSAFYNYNWLQGVTKKPKFLNERGVKACMESIVDGL